MAWLPEKRPSDQAIGTILYQTLSNAANCKKAVNCLTYSLDLLSPETPVFWGLDGLLPENDRRHWKAIFYKTFEELWWHLFPRRLYLLRCSCMEFIFFVFWMVSSGFGSFCCISKTSGSIKYLRPRFLQCTQNWEEPVLNRPSRINESKQIKIMCTL